MTNVVIYTASWCKRCKDLKSLYEEVAKDNPDIEFTITDIDQMDEDTERIPSTVPFVLIKKENGEIVELTGYNEINGSLEMTL